MPPQPERTLLINSVAVGIAEYAVKKAPARIVTHGLGSCLAIAIYSPEHQTGGLAHVMLPVAFGDDVAPNPAKYADTAVVAILNEMKEIGIRPKDLVAKLAGGAEMFPGMITRRIGARNALSARKTLGFYNVRVLSEDVGGNIGRSVEFFIDSGDLLIRTLKGVIVRI